VLRRNVGKFDIVLVSYLLLKLLVDIGVLIYITGELNRRALVGYLLVKLVIDTVGVSYLIWRLNHRG